MLNKHMKGLPGPPQDPDCLSLTDVVPTSVIARVLEKPEPLLLNSAQSSSCSRPASEDVFVHVDMTGGGQQNGSCSLGGESGGEEAGGGAPSIEKLNPYPPPPPPHPLYPGRKVIEFSCDDKVKIPKNSPLPNCTYATRQAISLSLVQQDEGRASPAHSCSSGGQRRSPSSQRDPASEPLSNQSSPFSSPPQAPSLLPSSSSEEDLLANWQRMFVEKMAPGCQRGGGSGGGRGGYSDGEEGSISWTPSRGSSMDTDTEGGGDTPVPMATSPAPQPPEEEEEGRDVLPQDLPVITPPRLMDPAPPLRPPRSPKRMGVHHLTRKDSLTRAQEHGTLLD
ncbi:Tight junction-associated protein 1 [Dissostichus eleginoides]|uniref:Tight junction-associated protein 1 n=1 Tax=Dissostichus eleginoides TaxID=100907 RepID=A0AAD9B295_DISEL|nr:Tight junction-associated protein 1 [Dissostichus eleginoides]